ncbi:MAG: potassium channel protein [Betaproteobacteria bacterium]|nr:potassium channel protein [Betaproteobacteria bacterium]
MDSILFLILRRLRLPINLIIISFAISVLGFTLIPGVDAEGNPWQMSVFDAFYVVSYTATTIGFGEIPYAFNHAQRLWMIFSIFMTVTAWFYAIGRIIALLQDDGLRRAIITNRFANVVQALQEPFYILCSYGESASLLTKALDEKGMRVVVIETLQERIDQLELSNSHNAIPHLCADAKLPENLIRAGILHRFCSGVVTLTDNDEANLAIAVAVKLMAPDLPVLARAERNDIAANMASFGTDHIINPYTLFGEQLVMRVHAIGSFILHEWLTDTPGDQLPPPEYPPRGRWIVCGYGRFGKSVVDNLTREQITTTIIEADPELTGCDNCIVGSGAEARTLLEADIMNATGLVAGTDNDINNLSIVMTAYELNPNLFVVIRKNKRHNGELFKRFNANITMQPTDIIAHECLAHMVTPLLAQFLVLVRSQTNEWSNNLISHLVAIVGENVPETWSIKVSKEETYAISELTARNVIVTLRHLTQDPTNRDEHLALVPLMLSRNNQNTLIPNLDTPLMEGDQILLCATPEAKSALFNTLNNNKTLSYIIDGIDMPNSFVWRWLKSITTKI